MKTIRVTGIALSTVALLLVAMAPPASAVCPANSGKLKGTYAFRLGPAKGFDADLANNGDPGNVSGAPRQDILRVGVFTSDGCGGTISFPGHTLATTDTNTGDTWLINFTWTATYSLNSDLTGTLTITPAAFGTWVCTDTTTGSPATCTGTEEGPETYSISVSSTNGRVELAETDNSGGGAKIFMVGEALKQ